MALKGKTPEGFLNALVAAGLLDKERVPAIVEHAATEQRPLVVYLIEHETIDGAALAKVASEFYKLPLFNLSEHDFSKLPKEFMELPIVRDGYGIPIEKKENDLIFAVIDPDIPSLQDLTFLTGCQLKFVVVDFAQLRQALDTSQTPLTDIDINDDLGDEFEDIDISAYEDDAAETVEYQAIDTPIVRYVNKIVLDAVRSKSSDIHFEPYETYYRVRYRQDGVLYEISKPPL